MAKEKIDIEQKFRERIKNNPEDLEALLELGVLLIDKNSLEEAESVFRTMVEKDKTNPEVWYYLGMVLHKLQKNEEAEEAYQKSIQINHESANSWFNLAVLLNQRKDFINAKDAFLQVLKIDPEDYIAWTNLGDIYQDLEDYTQADVAYTNALIFNPEYDRASYEYALLLINKKNQLEKAEEVIRKALDFHPFCTLLVKILYHLKNINYYIPSIINANLKKKISLGSYDAFIVDEINSALQIQYKYVLFLYESKDKHLPIYYVSAEKNDFSFGSGTPSYFLCAFEEKGHVNFGLDESIGDIDVFIQKALDIVRKKYNISLE